MKIIKMNLSVPYNIIIDNGIINYCGKFVREISHGKKAFIISDSNVSAVYAETVIQSLNLFNFETKLFSFEAGEKSKNLSTVHNIYNKLLDFGITRADIIIALGGGVTGDITGFCASTFLRGIPYVQVPTSLLSQIDSCVGGKTGVNLPSAKNSVGTFYQPSLVLIDPNTLHTLPKRNFSDGIAEGIKYALISDKKLFSKLKNLNINDFIEEFIFNCLSIKKELVEQDVFDKGNRMLLNFGHTIGHAVESHYKYSKFYHGEAISIGMFEITKLGESLGLTKPGTSDEIEGILLKFNLPTKLNLSPLEISSELSSDKKNFSGTLNIILISEIGKGFIYPIALNEFIRLLESSKNNEAT